MFKRHTHNFAHGIHVDDHKDETNHLAIQRFPFAPLLVLPLQQHIGRPSLPVVREGEEVQRGQVIARADGHMSVPLHAPESGLIKTIDRVPGINGHMVQGIYLQAFPGATQEVAEGTACDWQTADAKQIVQAIQDAGIVGLGGAAFPTHVKLQPPADKPIDTLLINGIECEPYLTTDHRVMLEQTQDIFTGIRYLLKITDAPRAIIGVEANKRDAVSALRQAVPDDMPVSVEMLPVKYPQGAEKMLIKALLDREVPAGSHSYEAGVVGVNVATAAEIGRLLPHGRGIQERVITVGGPGIINKGNYRIPIGTPLRFLLDTVGVRDDISRIFLGGPMMGQAVPDLDIAITKGVSGVIAFTQQEFRQPQRVYHCIHCGRCVDACPMGLNPAQLGLLAQQQDYHTMEQSFNLRECFECGACSFVCPSHIPLVQYFRIAKSNLKKQQAA
jgi:electron transport complex protein RnfC